MRFSLIRRNRIFQKNYMKTSVRKLLRAGLVRARAWVEDKDVGNALHRKAEIEEEQAAASSSRQEGISVALTFHGSDQIWKLMKNYPQWARLLGRRVWLGK